VRNALVMALKDLHLLWRDKFALFWVAVFPLMMALFVGAIFGGSGPTAGIGVAVVDLDRTDASRAFVAALEGSESIRIEPPSEGAAGHTRESARALVGAGDVTAYLVVPPGYGESGTLPFGRPGPTIEVGIDPARRAEAGYLHGLIVKAAIERMREGFDNPAAMTNDVRRQIADVEGAGAVLPPEEQQALLGFLRSLESFTSRMPSAAGGGDGDGVPLFEPVRVEVEPVVREGVRPPNAFAISFPQAMSWGVIGCCATFAIGLVQERARGTYGRLRMAPNPAWAILAGKALACFTACVGSALLLIALGLVLGVPIGSWVALAAALGSFAFGFTGFMMLISTLGRTEQSVSGAGWAAMMPLAMLGGSMVPLMVMPAWMLKLSNLSPIKWMILAVEGATWRGFTLGDMVLPCAILIGFGIVGFVAGAVVITRRSW
jgi:ABC-2 type transport system permease protein